MGHAVAPGASAVVRSSGSAFNGFTAEVSLGPQRASGPAKKVVAIASGADSDRLSGEGPGEPLLVAEPVSLADPPMPPAMALASQDRSSLPVRTAAYGARAPPVS